MKVIAFKAEGSNQPDHYPAEMVIRLKSGDPLAFKMLYNGYCRRLYAFAYSYLKCNLLAEELVHDALVKVWENREQLDEVRPVEPYLFRIAKNLVLDTFRKNTTDSLYKKYAQLTKEPSQNSTENDIIYSEYEKLAQEAIEKLPPIRKLIFNMSREQSLSYAEIATELNISAKTVESQMSKALKHIKAYLKADIILIPILLFVKI
jgi:RNA polymerase sigma-70 factor (ECF subfamily)